MLLRQHGVRRAPVSSRSFFMVETDDLARTVTVAVAPSSRSAADAAATSSRRSRMRQRRRSQRVRRARTQASTAPNDDGKRMRRPASSMLELMAERPSA